MVFLASIARRRRAPAPTITVPDGVHAATDGSVVRASAPRWASSSTCPSTAAAVLVVPRSIPIVGIVVLAVFPAVLGGHELADVGARAVLDADELDAVVQLDFVHECAHRARQQQTAPAQGELQAADRAGAQRHGRLD